MATVAGGISIFPCTSSGRRECVARDGAIENARVGFSSLSIGWRVLVTGGAGRRSALTVVSARRASSGDRTDKQREEKRRQESIPSSPPPPSTASNSVGVKEENEIEEAGAASEAAGDDELAARGIAGDGETMESKSSDEQVEKTSTGGLERVGSVDEIGEEMSELRRQRGGLGLQESASTSGFWKGVAEETSLIDWPVFSKVLGTTGVVVAMILGSSVVLLTVNAILAASSDLVFNDHAIRELVKP